jgi:hypothetical protein
VSNRRKLREKPRGRLRLPCPWCPSMVVLTPVEDAWDLFTRKPTPAEAFDALGAWHCHNCGAAGLLTKDEDA